VEAEETPEMVGVEEAIPEDGDYLNRLIREAREAVRRDPRLRRAVEEGQFTWGQLVGWIKDAVRNTGVVRDEEEIKKIAYDMSRKILKEFFGKEGEGWHTKMDKTEDGNKRVVVVLKPEGQRRFLEAWGEG